MNHSITKTKTKKKVAGARPAVRSLDQAQAENESGDECGELPAEPANDVLLATESDSLIEEARLVDEKPKPAARRAGDPRNFLAMYFRDMAALDVLKPEEEFETARKIEEMEIDLWRILLGFVPAVGWVADLVSKAVDKTLPELQHYRALSERARGKASIPMRRRLAKDVEAICRKLKKEDMDRVYVDVVLGAVRTVDDAIKAGRHGLLSTAPSNTKAFRVFLRTALVKAAQIRTAKNVFVKANLRLVVSIARRFNHGRLPFPDLIQEGNIGLMKAVERYDYRRGFRFSTYASWWIRHAVGRALADKGRAVRLPVHMIDAYHRLAKSERELQAKFERPATAGELAQAMGVDVEKVEKMKTFLAETPISLDRPLSDEDGRRLIDVLVDPNEAPNPTEQLMRGETQREVLTLLGGLKPIEADILRKRFGLKNDRECTLKEIGDEYSLSRERVRQLQEQALSKMRKAMAKGKN
jgi:RNA polymerase primary sigma factor